MTLDAYVNQTLDRIASHLGPWAGVHNAGHTEALVAIGVALIALWMGLIAATRLLAQVSAGTSFGLALTWLVLLFGTDAACRIYEVPPAGTGAAVFGMLALVVFAATRALNTSWPRAVSVLGMSCVFGGMAAVLLSLFVKLMNSI